MIYVDPIERYHAGVWVFDLLAPKTMWQEESDDDDDVLSVGPAPIVVSSRLRSRRPIITS